MEKTKCELRSLCSLRVRYTRYARYTHVVATFHSLCSLHYAIWNCSVPSRYARFAHYVRVLTIVRPADSHQSFVTLTMFLCIPLRYAISMLVSPHPPTHSSPSWPSGCLRLWYSGPFRTKVPHNFSAHSGNWLHNVCGTWIGLSGQEKWSLADCWLQQR